VGNWPGVTVEKKEGRIRKFGRDLTFIDLPGTYSLTPFSIEEIVARDFLLDNTPDVVIDIIDASNLERSLYLATQIRELDCKVLYALNMADVARTRGVNIDAEKLSELLNVPVVFTVGNRNEGTDTLLEKAVELAGSKVSPHPSRKVKYSKDIEEAISGLQEDLQREMGGSIPYDPRWTAIKLLENDAIVTERVLQRAGQARDSIRSQIRSYRQVLKRRFSDDPEIVMTDERYGFISGIIRETVTATNRSWRDMSRNVDLVLTNRFVGFPIFIFFIWAMFQLTFSLGAYPMEWIEAGIQALSGLLETRMPQSLLKDLLINGIVAGVGSVIIFLPNILILFFCIALFEDTGYMARAAFLMDKIMHLIGLHGKSFIPMLMGFGCNVPAVMASRSLESQKDRILTILITPFMSCSAKLPVYIALAGTFFAAKAGNVIFAIYLLGIVLAMVTGRLFRSILFKGQDAPFVMELPPYRVPMLRSLLIHMWDRSKVFLRKMGGVILVGSIIVWAMSTFPRQPDLPERIQAELQQVKVRYETVMQNAETATDRQRLQAAMNSEMERLAQHRYIQKLEHSYMGMLGKLLAPVFVPLGIDWRGGIALMTGFVAKEIVVSTLGVLYAVEDASGSEALQGALRSSGMTPLTAVSMMIFVLLYLPCLATVAAIRRETGSTRWMFFSIGYSTGVAWLVSFFVYQGGRLIGLG
jgi:ferrous iron transport protein B